MPACQGCHRAKVRCDQGQPACGRCLRLRMECLPHVSRQGQGPKKRKASKDAVKSEDERVFDHLQEFGRHHFGVKYLVHMFVAIAYTRRSFSLLGQASKLAEKSGIPMDEIFSKETRDILDPIMYLSAKEQRNGVEDTSRLTWSDIPSDLLEAGFAVDDGFIRSQRYIMIREVEKGRSRYLVSEAFGRDIVSLSLIEETWRNNDQPVVRLFLEGPSDFEKFTQALFYQVSRFREPCVKPECVRVNGFQVKKNASPRAHEMDLVLALEITNLQQSFVFYEFVYPKKQIAANKRASTKIDETDADSVDTFPLFDDLGNLTMDKDLEMFLELLNND